MTSLHELNNEEEDILLTIKWCLSMDFILSYPSQTQNDIAKGDDE
jgi:hypothetical protein